jgi:peptide/nickel transport system permease protein
MKRYVIRRILLLLLVVFGVVTATFFIMHLTPGDPVRTFLGSKAPQSAVDALRQQWGLDASLGQQYLNLLTGIVTGNLGTSHYYNSSEVSSLLVARLPVTLVLMFFGALLAVVIAVPLAVASSADKRGIVATVIRSFNAIVQGMPAFFVGSFLIVLLGVRIRLFPAGGYPSDLLGQARALVLPSLTIALSVVPILVRSLSNAMQDVAGSEYVAFARSKGLSPRRVLGAYVLRNASVPGVSVLGIQIGALAGGTLVVEQVFALPGAGSMLMTGILTRDYPVIQGTTMAFAIIVVLVFFITDFVYAALDPRVRLA